jgi:membrane-bound lytic murein transglycosylase B
LLKINNCGVLVIVTTVLMSFLSPTFAQTADETFKACLATLGERARDEGVDAGIVASVLKGTKRLERVIELDRSQPEFTSTFADYYLRRVTTQRVDQGRALYEEHRSLLNRLQLEYGVPAHYLLSFWGLETNYGSYFGSMRTTDALATLACDPRRTSFFTDQFISALKIVASGDIELEQMRGSWAGAIGHVQFLPSIFLKYAVDGDGDGRRDLWGSIPDALASAANFLRSIGWQQDLRWGREIHLPQKFDYSLAGRDQKRSLTEWVDLGVTDAYGGALSQLDISAAVLVPGGHRGPVFLVYDNFEVIMRWNRSEYYAISVGRLADRIAGSVALTRDADPDSEKITLVEVTRLQQNLVLLGYEAGKADGMFGPATRRALSQFQQAKGMIADGHLSRRALQAVHQDTASLSN